MLPIGSPFLPEPPAITALVLSATGSVCSMRVGLTPRLRPDAFSSAARVYPPEERARTRREERSVVAPSCDGRHVLQEFVSAASCMCVSPRFVRQPILGCAWVGLGPPPSLARQQERHARAISRTARGAVHGKSTRQRNLQAEKKNRLITHNTMATLTGKYW
jgi:hypothetical protein